MSYYTSDRSESKSVTYWGSIRVDQTQRSEVVTLVHNSLYQLVHRCDSTTSCNHPNSVNLPFDHRAVSCIPQLKLTLSIILNVATNRSDPHWCVPRLHPVYVLCEQTSLLVLERLQVHFDKQINIACIWHFGHRVVVSLIRLSVDLRLEL